jgi:hypothetical protein
MRLQVIVIMAIAACGTPYQPKRALQLGAQGGYSSEPLTQGRQLAREEGDESTTVDETKAQASTRAGELCPTGYHVLDSESLIMSGSRMVGRLLISGSASVTMLVVQCVPPEIDDAELAPGVDAPDDTWWCATGNSGGRFQPTRAERMRHGRVRQ